MTLWEIDVYPAKGQPDLLGRNALSAARDFPFGHALRLQAAQGYLLQGGVNEQRIRAILNDLLVDAVVENAVIAPTGDPALVRPPGDFPFLVHVLPKPGVMDPVAQSALQVIQSRGEAVDAVRTMRKYWIGGIDEQQLRLLCGKVLANDSIEQVIVGPLLLRQLESASPSKFTRIVVPIRGLDDAQLMELSRTGQLYLTLVEMRTIQQHFRQLDRDPTDIELESIAQTWSEHCSHKTLAGRIAYRDENGERTFQNMLKETIFAATHTLRQRMLENDWCVSVFKDNAGIVRFDENFNVVFKVETHNHPSAIEPYGGANTGIGGVIRDPLGTGLGAKPVCNTDVFCFAPPDTPSEDLPPGTLHPRRIMKGVVAGVRDYGNRMGIPTVNGAIYFDPRYLGNPLVYCGNVGIIPRDKSFKKAQAGDWIVAIGGRTGRDGIHGATFSSAELTSESESISGGAVQIGNAIMEKMVLDVLLAARDRGLFSAVTDCGAGGFSSAVGEMGEEIGAEVWLNNAPLKYEGLSYAEIWISEAQERMVLSVPPESWPEFHALCAAEDVEATILGRFVPTGRLKLLYEGQEVGDLSMEFLHGGRPPVVRDAVYQPPTVEPLRDAGGGPAADGMNSLADALPKILASLNVASKEWVIRQYDHEVQAGSVIKPLVGVQNDGPSDAAVIRPILNSQRGLVIACGMNPRYGDFDPYHMAASAIDEAIRNCIAVGADPGRIAILDNFCWGHTDRPETLGSLVRAALACHDIAIAYGTPFISGKDSLNNEFSYLDNGQKRTIAIPATLLISALGQVDDIRKCVTMDIKRAGNPLYVVGSTYDELGGSHYALVRGLSGGQVPRVRTETARRTFECLHRAMHSGSVRSCHDASEGGLAVAVAEMCFAGGLGAELQLEKADYQPGESSNYRAVALLYSESNSRFVVEVDAERQTEFEAAMAGVAAKCVGRVTAAPELKIDLPVSGYDFCWDLASLKEAWQAPLRW
ncbi:MAG: phosphoribosylformylglycinamidine synthase subunit PurL [Planctomycetes bacterium]|nr:phosphoribosylformylglycinamidine synthase subunit PurL [Planctomycetota bacterium]